MRSQRTISREVSLTGFGYWSGKDVCVELRPAPAGSGIVFVRSDLPSHPRIAASVAHRIETPRRTTLTSRGVQVEMVEHLLAALAGLRVDNCEVWIDQPEVPGFDGSSREFVTAIRAAGVEDQPQPRVQLVITDSIRVGDATHWIEASPSQRATMSLSYELDYGPGPIGQQKISLDLSPAAFERELSDARTFLLEKEASWLQSQGLGARVSYQDLLVFDEDGVVDNELRYPDECVRHKALDVVGDLALAGCDIVGCVQAYRTGHQMNAEMVRALLAHGEMFLDVRKSA